MRLYCDLHWCLSDNETFHVLSVAQHCHQSSLLDMEQYRFVIDIFEYLYMVLTMVSI